MISLIIPTRNRAYTLKKVLPSYYEQQYVTEVIFIDDFGEDNTQEVIENISASYPNICTKYIRHQYRKGAAAGRITGYMNASNKYILFGEDDAYIDRNYSCILLEKIQQNENIGLVSGRIIYKYPNESNESSKIRFGHGNKKGKFFKKFYFGIDVNTYFSGDIEIPMTHALFLTRIELLKEFGYDPFYSKGNGFREESDFQINAFSHGYKILCTNETHCYHMSREEVYTGGQRINRFAQLYWNIYFTNYFFNKYFYKVKDKLNIKYNKNIAIICFSMIMIKNIILIPILKLPKFFWKRLVY